MAKVIEVHNLVKDFRSDFWKRKVRILNGVNLEVEDGDVYGFLGPNGSGKTTTLKILMGLVFPTSGYTRLFGEDSQSVDVKAKVGFLPENPYFYEYLKTEEFLEFYGSLFGLRGKALSHRIDYLLELVGMSKYRDLQLRKFSKGMLQRIGIAQALINDPNLIILDEPQSGLDPLGRKDVREIMLQLKSEGKTVFFSSHIMHDVETVCEKIAIILNGKVVSAGYIGDLLNPKVIYHDIIYRGNKISLSDLNIDQRQAGQEWICRAHSDDDSKRVINSVLDSGGQLVSVIPHKETLEDLFVDYIEKSKQQVQP